MWSRCSGLDSMAVMCRRTNCREPSALCIGRRELAELRAKGKWTTEDYQRVRELTRAIEQLEREELRRDS